MDEGFYQKIFVLFVWIVQTSCGTTVCDGRDHVLFIFETRIQIYVAVLNIGCEIQNSGGTLLVFLRNIATCMKYHFMQL